MTGRGERFEAQLVVYFTTLSAHNGRNSPIDSIHDLMISFYPLFFLLIPLLLLLKHFISPSFPLHAIFTSSFFFFLAFLSLIVSRVRIGFYSSCFLLAYLVFPFSPS